AITGMNHGDHPLARVPEIRRGTSMGQDRSGQAWLCLAGAAPRRRLARLILSSPCLRVSVVICLLAAGAWGQGAQGPGRKVPAEAERITDNLYRIGKVIVDLKARTVSCEGKVNMQRGLVEYFAVASHGKLHESVLELDVQPLHLQVGLLLLGLEPQGGL